MPLVFKKHLGNKSRSKLSERRAAKVFGGRVQPASGAINVAALKADVKSREFLVDDKTTNTQSYSLNVKTWRKLQKEAFMNRRRPAMRIEFADGPTLYVFDEQTTMNLLNQNG